MYKDYNHKEVDRASRIDLRHTGLRELQTIHLQRIPKLNAMTQNQEKVLHLFTLCITRHQRLL